MIPAAHTMRLELDHIAGDAATPWADLREPLGRQEAQVACPLRDHPTRRISFSVAGSS